MKQKSMISHIWESTGPFMHNVSRNCDIQHLRDVEHRCYSVRPKLHKWLLFYLNRHRKVFWKEDFLFYLISFKFIKVCFRLFQFSLASVSFVTIYGHEDVRVGARPLDVTSVYVYIVKSGWEKKKNLRK